jgi:citrate lyase beta subunit
MMNKTFSVSHIENILAKLDEQKNELRITNYESRSPVHVVYGGAHLFKSDTPQKLDKIALKSLQDYAPEVEKFAEIFNVQSEDVATVYERVQEKLKTEAVEDFRIDFEDGYGFRSDEEEDRHAIAASDELSKSFHQAVISPFCGFRIKSFQSETARRAVRTLDLFLTNLLEKTGGKLPENFVVTLPKVENPAQVAALVELLEEFERATHLPEKSLKLEILIETPTAILNERGEIGLRKLVEAAQGRCTAAHFGAYDFTSAFGIAAQYQHLRHPLCDFARNWMQVALAPLGIRLSDSVTTLIPVPIYKGDNLNAEQQNENRQAVLTAWREHFTNVTHSLSNGFYQSWDLHPAQLVARYAAVYSFFLKNLDREAERLRRFLDKATQASLTGNQFDDAASANGLLNFFRRAVSCKAIEMDTVTERTGLSAEELQMSFADLMERRR